MRELKVGDRVKIINISDKILRNRKGRIVGIDKGNHLLSADELGFVCVERRQLVPLRKKQEQNKIKGKVWWIKASIYQVIRDTPPEDPAGWICVEEKV